MCSHCISLGSPYLYNPITSSSLLFPTATILIQGRNLPQATYLCGSWVSGDSPAWVRKPRRGAFKAEKVSWEFHHQPQVEVVDGPLRWQVCWSVGLYSCTGSPRYAYPVRSSRLVFGGMGRRVGWYKGEKTAMPMLLKSLNGILAQ